MFFMLRTITLEPIGEKLIEDLGDLKILLSSRIQSICPPQL